MQRNRSAITRAAAALIAALTLLAAAPQPAVADGGGIWGQWVGEVTDRSPAEVPLAILVSIPAMLITTPFWLGSLVVDKLKGEEED